MIAGFTSSPISRVAYTSSRRSFWLPSTSLSLCHRPESNWCGRIFSPVLYLLSYDGVIGGEIGNRNRNSSVPRWCDCHFHHLPIRSPDEDRTRIARLKVGFPEPFRRRDQKWVPVESNHKLLAIHPFVDAGRFYRPLAALAPIAHPAGIEPARRGFGDLAVTMTVGCVAKHHVKFQRFLSVDTTFDATTLLSESPKTKKGSILVEPFLKLCVFSSGSSLSLKRDIAFNGPLIGHFRYHVIDYCGSHDECSMYLLGSKV